MPIMKSSITSSKINKYGIMSGQSLLVDGMHITICKLECEEINKDSGLILQRSAGTL